MAANLLRLLADEWSGDAVAKLAAMLGEPPAATQSALAATGLAVIGALAQRAAAPGGGTDVLGLIQ